MGSSVPYPLHGISVIVQASSKARQVCVYDLSDSRNISRTVVTCARTQRARQQRVLAGRAAEDEPEQQLGRCA